jgi:hypothetical protein
MRERRYSLRDTLGPAIDRRQTVICGGAEVRVIVWQN